MSKSSSECSIDQEGFSYSIDGKSRISEGTARTAKSRARNNIIESILIDGTHKK